MILGNIMQMFEDILYEEDERAITGFINSNGDLEYSIYECIDGGFIDFKNRGYNKDELLKLLEIELDNFANRNIPTLFILGHNIIINLANDKYVDRDELDDEVYEISHSIMQGNDSGDIFIDSIKDKASWKIAR